MSLNPQQNRNSTNTNSDTVMERDFFKKKSKSKKLSSSTEETKSEIMKH